MSNIIVNDEFITKYASLITDTMCKSHNIDIADATSRAILAYNLLNPNDKIVTTNYELGDEKTFVVLPDGDVIDEERGTYVMDMISALLHPALFRDTLFHNPTSIRVNYVKDNENIYTGNIMFAKNLISLGYI